VQRRQRVRQAGSLRPSVDCHVEISCAVSEASSIPAGPAVKPGGGGGGTSSSIPPSAEAAATRGI